MKSPMLEEIFLEINTRYDSNIYIHQCGQEICRSNHSYGPAIRDHYLIHFIISGKGKYHFNNKIYQLQAGDIFLISPSDVTYYQADTLDPWHYVWVGFHGIKATQYLNMIGLTRENPTISVSSTEYVKTRLLDIYQNSKIRYGGEIYMLGHLYLLLGKLVEEAGGEKSHRKGSINEHIFQAIEYIEMHYGRNISIQDIADHTNLNRSYFTSLFKETINISPQQFLTKYRVNKACDLLKLHAELSIADIARSVGYQDQFSFSKVFKKEKGIPPREFRNSLAKEHHPPTP